MSKKTPSLSRLLQKKKFPAATESKSQAELKDLKLKMLRIQQGIWHRKQRAIVVFEGIDAAGKGGAIRRLTEALDPRSLRVYHSGPPTAAEQGRHFLYRFWRDLPEPGMIAVFDRSWYGRLLVERVERLAPKRRIRDAYDEINEFEAMLSRDGVDIVKIFLAIDREEQLKRFEARLRDPYKQWKLEKSDIETHYQWADYVRAADLLLKRTNKPAAPWHLIPADSKEFARVESLRVVTQRLGAHGEWMDTVAQESSVRELRESLSKIENARSLD